MGGSLQDLLLVWLKVSASPSLQKETMEGHRKNNKNGISELNGRLSGQSAFKSWFEEVQLLLASCGKYDSIESKMVM